MDTPNASITVAWEDEDNRHSFLLVLKDYDGLKLLQAKDLDENTCEITLYGKKEEVELFREDFEEDSFPTLDNMSQSLEFDEDYEGWLNNEVWYAKKLFEYDGNPFEC